jgi:lipoprotein NlpD
MIGDRTSNRCYGCRSLALALLLVALLPGCGPGWTPERPEADRSGRLTQEGRYRVQSGDSLHVIAFNFGLDWRDVAQWNGIAAPYTIYPDQELRLSPPAGTERGVVVQPAQGPGRSVSRDLASERPTPATPPPVPAAAPEGVPGTAVESSTQPPTTVKAQQDPAEPARTTASAPAPAAKAGADPTSWLWPTEGRLLSRFRANDPARNGIEIGGADGQPVRAAAAGEVVYSGNGLIGYGELIIIKHSDRILSAYAHNRQRLVAEGQSVGAGDRIGEMGRDDRNQPLLHFEIRVNGAPQDPLNYLPRR